MSLRVQPLALACTSLPVRRGHMVKLPGNVWSTKPWIKTNKKPWIPLKGTNWFKLDTVRPSEDLLRRSADPVITKYAYQLDGIPRTKACDPLQQLCKLTRTARPVALSELHHGASDVTSLSEAVAESCESYNRLYHQKGLSHDRTNVTPIQLDKISRHFAAGFLQNLIRHIITDSPSESLLSSCHISSNVRTGAFWQVDLARWPDDKSKSRCHQFQLVNFVDIMLRSRSPLSYTALRNDENAYLKARWAELTTTLSDVCVGKLVLFKETRMVEQFPGFIKESLYPYNHTLFKVCEFQLSFKH